MASSPEDTRTNSTDNRSAQKLAEFVASANVPPDTRKAAQAAFLDTVGVALAGAVEPGARIVQRVVAAEGGAPQAGVFGTNRRASASGAALANGTAAHALDYD